MTNIFILQLRKQRLREIKITQLLSGRPELNKSLTSKSFIFFLCHHTCAHTTITHSPTWKPLSRAGLRTATRVRPLQQPSLLVLHVFEV